ncbi:hypothetical protein [Methylobacterium oxalidis]|uniref:Uncharacterized protein n=1 Tax=Methylobacterium oxalidis TaxID=944322 RepID=A0A512IXA7_9HYPH|nr:hypothetical protein [Methylobacterium oxalidis]GEP02283.1 hypothetical protein MOX02_03210 [Methylobacterium oxalidis]GJE32273.1 hypothetical protein LDDCCGHA_2459 [Methylobacterium oxalidis]GLS62228.1 hypothetical protein GCM10007888_06090 [Methylobacterium oxalidis]
MTELQNKAEALAAMAAAVREAAPLPEAHAEVSKILNERVHVADDGSTTVYDTDGKSLMFDEANGYANATPATLMRELRQSRPDLFVKTTALSSSTKPSGPVAHVNGRFAPKHELPAHDTGKPNLTKLMASAKAGNAAALAQLQALTTKSR